LYLDLVYLFIRDDTKLLNAKKLNTKEWI